MPTGIPFDPEMTPRMVDCFGVELVMLHPFGSADFPSFTPVPERPWLWRNGRGALMLAFNLAGFVERFIDFGDERAIPARDRHGRLPAGESTLRRLGVLHRPLLNTYFFAVLAVAKGHGTAATAIDPSEHVCPPVLVLSHDCDQLRGNDAITQGVRLYRLFAPLRRLRPPAFANARHILENALFPRRHYFDDALAMARAEQRYGFRSAFYFLNGMGGRLGARSGSPIIAEFARQLPADAELGIHYNYGHALDRNKLIEQKRELEGLTGREIRSGRAHYLAFDPHQSFAVLSDVGIETDESLGFPDLNGFRVGFAGAFGVGGPHDPTRRRVVEIPLHFMDTNTMPRTDDHDLLRMVGEVEQVGGVVTLLFHPGAFDTPEAADLRGLYESYLAHFHTRGYRSMLPSELGDLVRETFETPRRPCGLPVSPATPPV